MTICVTTCHLEGWKQYGHRLLSGWQHFPKDCELRWYTEGYEIPPTDRVTAVDNATLDDLQKFKERHRHYKPPSYVYDVVRFSHKIFAVLDAFKGRHGLGVWVDADIVPYADVPEGYFEQALDGAYLAMFRRKGMYSECGFWIVDLSHPSHPEFMERLRQMYVGDGFKSVHEWHDSYLMDIVVRGMEREGKISVTNLSGKWVEHDHPMAKADIAKYLDHAKGPARKVSGISRENEYRAA